MTANQQEKARTFRALHVAGDPLILFNAWDAGSAKVIAGAGAKAIGTGSWSVAAANGFPDGEEMPLDLVLANAGRIVTAVDLPVTIDLVRGYGATASEVGQSIARLAATGAVGCNIEDTLPDGHSLFSVREQSERVRAAKEAGGETMFINARVDLFLRTAPAAHDETLLGDALSRAGAYSAAGADGIFVPGLVDEALIRSFCDGCPKPVNIMASPAAPAAERLAALGVARISHGPGPYRRTMQFLEEAARAAHSR